MELILGYIHAISLEKEQYDFFSRFSLVLFIKRVLDIVTAITALLLCSWLFLIIAVLVKISSKGNIIYRQERVGLNGKLFTMFKFRTMYSNAELNGPKLSQPNDKRITLIGKLLRNYHLDELPQFINVLRGDMSVVGTRPERQYYIEQIMQKAPEYRYILKHKPGITSIGQIKFGYAKNVDEMIERLQYDLNYVQHFSLLKDLKILLKTIGFILLKIKA